MTNERLLENLLGFMAYDHGCLDSGIHDEVLKAKCKQLIDERRDDEELIEAFRGYVRWLLSPEGREQGYDLEDIYQFLTYLGDEFNWDVR